MSLDLEEIVKRAREKRIPVAHLAYILDQPIHQIRYIIAKLEHNHTGPNAYSDGYYMHALKTKTIQEIADEIGCSRQAIYKLLNRRGLSVDAYRMYEEKETPK